MPPTSDSPTGFAINSLPAFKPDLHERAWSSTPHPTLPLIATAHARSVTVFSLANLSSHSVLQGGHTRSVRSASWKPGLPPHKLCLVTGSFDATAGVWRWDENDRNEKQITASSTETDNGDDGDSGEWEFTLVLEGHDSEIKSCAFSPSGAHLATCSRDKSIWIWEDIGASETDDEWETVAVLTEHEGDVKSLSWCPDVPGRSRRRGVYGADCLVSASYDDTARVWREDGDAEWVCVAVLEGHSATVWGAEWEGDSNRTLFPRLLTYSADGTLKIWTLEQEEEQDDETATEGDAGRPRNGLGGIPNTMRTSLRETWKCTATLPAAHTPSNDVYSASWSRKTGLIASTGSDGSLAVYKENKETGEWEVLGVRQNAHGPFEVNHVTWCGRWDGGRGGTEEMLVTTGDDGVVRPWEIVLQ